MFPSYLTPKTFNKLGENTAVSNLGIEVTEIGLDYIKAIMPVDSRTVQPFGLLHGGASVLLAESLGSMASSALIDQSKQAAVGIEINANHIKGVKSGGLVTGIARALHLGRRIHVWEIKITDNEDKLVCISRLTVSVIDRNG